MVTFLTERPLNKPKAAFTLRVRTSSLFVGQICSGQYQMSKQETDAENLIMPLVFLCTISGKMIWEVHKMIRRRCLDFVLCGKNPLSLFINERLLIKINSQFNKAANKSTQFVCIAYSSPWKRIMLIYFGSVSDTIIYSMTWNILVTNSWRNL